MIPIGPWTPYLALIKAGLIALLLAVVFGLGWKSGSGHTAERWQRARDEQVSEYQSALAHAREAERASYAKSQEVSRGYQDELARLRARPVDRGRPVRLCIEPAAGSVPAAGAAAGGPGTPIPAGGVVSGGVGTDPVAGPDIGADLRELARRADEVSAQGRALQAAATSTD